MDMVFGLNYFRHNYTASSNDLSFHYATVILSLPCKCTHTVHPLRNLAKGNKLLCCVKHTCLNPLNLKRETRFLVHFTKTPRKELEGEIKVSCSLCTCTAVLNTKDKKMFVGERCLLYMCLYLCVSVCVCVGWEEAQSFNGDQRNP